MAGDLFQPAPKPATRGETERPRDRLDTLIALTLGVLATALYGLCFQTRLYGNDGCQLCNWFAVPGGDPGAYYNVLYGPTARLLARLLPFTDPLAGIKAASALGGGLALPFVYLVCRGFDAHRRGALAATLLLGLAPAYLFFATTVEVHAQHVLAVAFVSWVILAAPWRRPLLALLPVALLFPLLNLTHQTAILLAPGMVLLVQVGRRRQAPPFTLPQLTLVGAVLALSFLFSHMLANALMGHGFTVRTGGNLALIHQYHLPFKWGFLWDEWLLPLAFLLPAAAAGAWRLRRRPLALLTVAVLLLPSWAFFTWWGYPERGAYFLGSAPFLAVLAARSELLARVCGYGTFLLARIYGTLRRRAEAAITTVLLVTMTVLLVTTQGILAFAWVADYDQGFDIDERVRVVRRLLGEKGQVFSLTLMAPEVEIYLPGVKEDNLGFFVSVALNERSDPEQWSRLVVDFIRQKVGDGGKALLDVSYLRDERYDLASDRLLTTLRKVLDREMKTTFHDHPWWPMVELEIP